MPFSVWVVILWEVRLTQLPSIILLAAIGADGLLCQCRDEARWQGARANVAATKGKNCRVSEVAVLIVELSSYS